jgi:hypothetical protein
MFSQDLRYMFTLMYAEEHNKPQLYSGPKIVGGMVGESNKTVVDHFAAVLEECAKKWPVDFDDAEIDAYYADQAADRVAAAAAEAVALAKLKAVVAAATSRDEVTWPDCSPGCAICLLTAAQKNRI